MQRVESFRKTKMEEILGVTVSSNDCTDPTLVRVGQVEVSGRISQLKPRAQIKAWEIGAVAVYNFLTGENGHPNNYISTGTAYRPRNFLEYAVVGLEGDPRIFSMR